MQKSDWGRGAVRTGCFDPRLVCVKLPPHPQLIQAEWSAPGTVSAPARLPQTPAYSPLPPPDDMSALKPPPPIMACSRVLIVSMGYSAEQHSMTQHNRPLVGFAATQATQPAT
jgi:hypothetical protein